MPCIPPYEEVRKRVQPMIAKLRLKKQQINPKRYSIRLLEKAHGIYELSDKEAGTSVNILPHGSNLIGMSIDHGKIQIIKGPKTFKEHPLTYGMPILFPFPDRIKNGKFSFRGKTYQLKPIIEGHAIHGLVYDKPWDVVNISESDDSASLTYRLNSESSKDIKEQFPFDFEISMTYMLKEGRLEILPKAVNNGSDIMPMGFGLHLYLNAPLTSAGTRDECLVMVPADKYWEILPDNIPTGRLLDVSEECDLRNWRKIEGIAGARYYTHLRLEDGKVVCSYYDPYAKVKVKIISDEVIKNTTVYSLKDQKFVCIEPLTCAVDGFNLESKGIDAGVIKLKPKQEFHCKVSIVPQKVEAPPIHTPQKLNRVNSSILRQKERN